MRYAKAQSAIEYLMSYGWAIIVVLLAVGALYALGAFSSNNLSTRLPSGACVISRTNVFGTTQGPVMTGQCQGGLPQYVLTSVNPIAGSYVVASGPQIEATNGSFTLAFWVSTTYPNISQIAVAKGNVYGICFGGGGITLGDTHGHYYVAPLHVNSAQWYFVAVSYSNQLGVAQIYVNGSDIGSATSVPFNFTQSSSTMYLSGIKSGTTCGTNVGLTGLLANVQLYNQVLSPAEVQSIYLSGIGSAPAQLQSIYGWWPLNGNLQDYSGFNQTGMIVGHNNNFTAFWTAGYGGT